MHRTVVVDPIICHDNLQTNNSVFIYSVFIYHIYVHVNPPDLQCNRTSVTSGMNVMNVCALTRLTQGGCGGNLVRNCRRLDCSLRSRLPVRVPCPALLCPSHPCRALPCNAMRTSSLRPLRVHDTFVARYSVAPLTCQCTCPSSGCLPLLSWRGVAYRDQRRS